jgi:hypothetical protein
MIKFIYLFILYFKNKYIINIKLYLNNFKLNNNEINEPLNLTKNNTIILLNKKNKKLNNTKNGYDKRYKSHKINIEQLNKLNTDFIIYNSLKENNSINILNLIKNNKYILDLKEGNLFKDWDFEF